MLQDEGQDFFQIEAGVDDARRLLQRLGYLPPALLGLVQPRVLDGDGGLVRQGLSDRGVRFGVEVGLCAVNHQGADHLVAHQEWHPDPGADILGPRHPDPALVLPHIGDNNGPVVVGHGLQDGTVAQAQGNLGSHQFLVLVAAHSRHSGLAAGEEQDGGGVVGQHALRLAQDEGEDIVQFQRGAHGAGDFTQSVGALARGLLGLVQPRVLDGDSRLVGEERGQPDVVLAESPDPAALSEFQGADDLTTTLEGHAEDGGERFGLPVRRPSLPMAIVGHGQRCVALQHLAAEPFAGRQTCTDVVPRVAMADDELEVVPCLINEVDAPRPGVEQAAALFHDVLQDFVKSQLSGNSQGDFPQRLQFFTPAAQCLTETDLLFGHRPLVARPGGQNRPGQDNGDDAPPQEDQRRAGLAVRRQDGVVGHRGAH